MEILGTILKRGFELRKTINKVRRQTDAEKKHRKTLLKLLARAQYTQFGQAFEFEAIMASKNPEKVFQKIVPIYDYNKIFDEWWHKSLQGQPDVCWPGKIKYFALSSGTSGSPSKQIPVTNAMIRSMRKTGLRQVMTLVNYGIPEEYFSKGVLVVGGSSDLVDMGNYYQGDLSGINQSKMPFYTSPFYKPGKEIARHRDWNVKIEEIVKNAHNWDIVMITGVPAWNQIIIEKIIEKHHLNNIHELWPNLSFFIYGGVAIEPYITGFNKLLGKPVHYVETYLASEGFIAYQARKDIKGMKLVTGNGIYSEFIPFNEQNFNADGTLKENPQVLTLGEVEEGVDYALLITTNAGAWRYMIGDTVKFTNKELFEIVISGRTKHFLSLCGEHLSVDNMNNAVLRLGELYNIPIKEYTVSGIQIDSLFGHRWYLAFDRTDIPAEEVKNQLDAILKELNDDYAVERQHALKDIEVKLVPTRIFYKWLEQRGKIGAQNKFPRVLNQQQYSEWEAFVAENINS